jgi:hypothetical protein
MVRTTAGCACSTLLPGPEARGRVTTRSRYSEDDWTLQTVVSAQLICEAYEANPLAYPRCKGPMRVIASVDEPNKLRGRAADAPARACLNDVGECSICQDMLCLPSTDSAFDGRRAGLPRQFLTARDGRRGLIAGVEYDRANVSSGSMT